jgi:D-glycerate 3-kinase
MSEIQDDKAQYCIPFILERLEAHRRQHEGEENAPPFFLGLNGVQGAGKTVLVTFLPPSYDPFQPLTPSRSL